MARPWVTNLRFSAQGSLSKIPALLFSASGVAFLEKFVERVRAGLRNARSKGKTLGRPKRIVDLGRIEALRAQGVGWKRIAAEMGVGVGTIYRIALGGSKIRQRDF
jgi:hypothetical protein